MLLILIDFVCFYSASGSLGFFLRMSYFFCFIWLVFFLKMLVIFVGKFDFKLFLKMDGLREGIFAFPSFFRRAKMFFEEKMSN